MSEGRDKDRIEELEASAVVDHDRIEALEADAVADKDRINVLEAAALDAEAATLVSDARIMALAAEVEGLTAAMQHRSVIEQAKGVLMHSMQIGPDAAFAVLVAASQREGVKLRDIAERIASSQDTDHQVDH